MCNCMDQDLCTHYKTQTPAAIPLFGHNKTLHTLTGMGGTALATAVALPARDKEVFKKIK